MNIKTTAIMKRMTILTAAFLCLFGLTESTEQNNQSSRNMEELNLTQEWDKTFPKSDKVNETVLLMTAGDNNEHTFDQALSYFHIISGVLGGKEVGTYLAGGCTGCENTARQIVPEHLEKAYKRGLEL